MLSEDMSSSDGESSSSTSCDNIGNSNRRRNVKVQMMATSTSVSSSSSSSSSSDDDDDDVDCTAAASSKSTSITASAKTTASATQFVNIMSSVTSGALQGIGWVIFSLYFPFVLAPHAATATYHTAFYHYDATKSLFDNTVWTYGTDYALAIIMSILAAAILSNRTSTQQRHQKSSSQSTSSSAAAAAQATTNQLCNRSASLLLLYGASVTAGGLSHHFFVSVESRNTLWFRCLWSLCVGTVCAASCSMGMAGSTMIRLYQQEQQQKMRMEQKTKATSTSLTTCLLLKAPVVSDLFWLCYGLTVTVICVLGWMSFQRPACDIFIAGITQSPPTFYCMLFFFLVDNNDNKNNEQYKVQRWAKLVGLVGFILNAPLLPMYPLLVQYTDWSLASVNTLLHSWLCVAWCMQGISMRHVIQVLARRQKIIKYN